MSRTMMLRVGEGGAEGALRDFLSSLLEAKVVDALLVPRELPSGKGFAQVLVREAAALEGAHPLAPTMPVQSARILSQLTFREPGARIAAVLKPCEARATVELAKFRQVRPESLVLVAVDCPGTVEVGGYAQAACSGADARQVIDALLAGMATGEPAPSGPPPLREACTLCPERGAAGDLAVGLFGYDTAVSLGITVGDHLEEELREKGLLGPQAAEPPAREEALARVAAARAAQREESWAAFHGAVGDLRALLDRFASCVRCRNCMEACPICYCRECVFKTSTFDHEPDMYLRWAERKGGVRMPTDTLLFHLIRMSHMATSCINCGLCDSACPAGLPVSTLFGSVGREVRAIFGYVPGRDVSETPPVATFREDELNGEI